MSHPKKVSKVANDALKQAANIPVAVRKARSSKSKTSNPCPKSDGCARASINGWEWHRWSLHASPAERARVRGIKYFNAQYSTSDSNASQWSNGKGLSARTNRVKMRNLLAAAEGADLLKSTQLKVLYKSHKKIALIALMNIFLNFDVMFYARQGKSVYASSGARYMIGVLLPWSQLRQKTLLLNMLEN